MSQSQILAQGAEAIISFNKGVVLKDRISKSYRIKEIDEKLRKQRTKREANLLEKAGKIILCPKLIKQNQFSLEIEFIQGDKLSQTLNSYEEEKQFKIMQILGEEVGKLHDADIIHGDLTTSNTILVESSDKNSSAPTHKTKAEPCNIKNPISINKLGGGASRPLNQVCDSKHNLVEGFQVFIIDFGLGFISKRIEDKAVDLHLIKQALEAKHFQKHKEFFNNFIKGYQPKEKTLILKQLEKVESRGRYKH
jgi:TP53 regulating kinase-like protein